MACYTAVNFRARLRFSQAASESAGVFRLALQLTATNTYIPPHNKKIRTVYRSDLPSTKLLLSSFLAIFSPSYHYYPFRTLFSLHSKRLYEP